MHFLKIFAYFAMLTTFNFYLTSIYQRHFSIFLSCISHQFAWSTNRIQSRG